MHPENARPARRPWGRPRARTVARWIAAVSLVLAAAAMWPYASDAQPAGVLLIVPGDGIGPVKIGMTTTQVRAMTDRLPCDIAVAYAEGRVSRMETNCGVAYQTAEGITVGLDGSRVWWVHGTPDERVPSNLAGVRADWLVYRGQGIGFRVIYADAGTLIQAISIFKGTGEPLPRRPSVPPVAPPPALGD
jgi:hypothetical protein